MIDTGISWRQTYEHGEYYTGIQHYLSKADECQLDRSEELPTPLQALGHRPEDVRRVVITHLLEDHIGGLFYLPRSEIIMSRDEWDKRRWKLFGFVPMVHQGSLPPAPASEFSNQHVERIAAATIARMRDRFGERLRAVAAFSARTDLLVLDEPTSGLDPLMECLFQRCVHEAVAQGRTVLLSSHILHQVEQLCGAVTIIKDGRLVESGQVAQMRHLAASSITATVTSDRIGEVRAALGRLAVPGSVSDAGSVDVRVAGADVNAVLGLLVSCDAEAVTCTPATLDDLFQRHYEVAAR